MGKRRGRATVGAKDARVPRTRTCLQKNAALSAKEATSSASDARARARDVIIMHVEDVAMSANGSHESYFDEYLPNERHEHDLTLEDFKAGALTALEEIYSGPTAGVDSKWQKAGDPDPQAAIAPAPAAPAAATIAPAPAAPAATTIIVAPAVAPAAPAVAPAVLAVLDFGRHGCG